MNLYNTLTQQLEPVVSADQVLRMYICGVTPYDTTHLGHAFTYICFDVLTRYLEYSGFRPTTVQNVTDIDDDILKRAAQVGITWDELARQETAKFQEDMAALNIRPPNYYPHATQEIPEILELVSRLLMSGDAYERKGSVYYGVQHVLDFGELSHMIYPQMLEIANQRGNVPDDPNKNDPLDFVLWQATKPGEPKWPSPWGDGRPGWHIECSAMSLKYLGPQIDIHAGGADLIFPHHSCEIVQSEHYTGVKPFVRHWFHIGMVRLGGEKMSKSLGNMRFVRDLLGHYSANAIRAYLLCHHYRSEWDADDSEAALVRAEQQVTRWQNALHLINTNGQDAEQINVLPYQERFRAALDNDLNTPRALEQIDELAEAIFVARASTTGNIANAQATLANLMTVLGFSSI
jgi:L-cysteine:1D-myo-inositol 2-amino-2-deoxy-alpha-D-glucopyranoside ligase